MTNDHDGDAASAAEEAQAARHAPEPPRRVKKEDIAARIASKKFLRDGTLTICVLELDNGIKLVGTSACVDPRLYDREKGEELAYDDAFDKAWPLMGMVLADAMRSDRLAAEQEHGHRRGVQAPVPMGSFGWAVEAMRSGLGVRRKAWGVVLRAGDDDYQLTNEDLFATDWTYA